MPPEQEQNVALSGKQILLAGLTYCSCEASLVCPLRVARLAWRAPSLSLACLLGVLSEPGVHLYLVSKSSLPDSPCPGVPSESTQVELCLVGG